jgi:hypothetical protein
MFTAQIGMMPPMERVIEQIVTTFLDGVTVRPSIHDEEG